MIGVVELEPIMADLHGQGPPQAAELLASNRRLQEEILHYRRLVESLQSSEGPVRDREEDLGRRVAERTEELTARVAELDAFCSTIAHDLRAPLRAISGYATMLREDCISTLGSEGTAHLVRIEANADKMLNMIEGLLDFSRLGEGEMVLASVDMQALVDSVVREMHERHAGDTKPEVTVGPLPVVSGDAALLRRVWSNLLSNAVKFSSLQPNPRIRVSAEQHNGEVVCSISDNGVGFDMTYVEQLFGVFNRLHQAEEFPGIGLGLAVVRRIVSRHAGRVWAVADAGGATFYFSLPASR